MQVRVASDNVLQSLLMIPPTVLFLV